MKKLLISILFLCILLIMCSCDTSIHTNDSNFNDLDSSQTTQNSNSSNIDATNIWSVGFSVDEFNQETDEWYVANDDLFLGEFSNSATTNSSLTVRMVAFGEGFTMEDGREVPVLGFMLYEYGSHQVKNSSGYIKSYNVHLRDDHGNEYDGVANVKEYSDMLILNERTVYKMLELMESSEEVYVRINEKKGMSTYLFSIKIGNFFDCYK